MTCGHEYPKPVRSVPTNQLRDYRKDPLSSQLLWAKSAPTTPVPNTLRYQRGTEEAETDLTWTVPRDWGP